MSRVLGRTSSVQRPLPSLAPTREQESLLREEGQQRSLLGNFGVLACCVSQIEIFLFGEGLGSFSERLTQKLLYEGPV